MANAANTARPADPSKISFDPRCFAVDGYSVSYVVVPVAGSAGYPERFSVEADAAKVARVRRVSYRTEKSPIVKRIAWTV